MGTVINFQKKTYQDVETGELIQATTQEVKATRKDFEMIFYGHLVNVLDDLGNRKIKVLKYIIENRDKVSNILIKTVREIAEELNFAIKTVNDVLILLEDKNIIKRKTGVIYITADFICDGRYQKNIMYIYQDVSNEETKEEKIKRMEREIKRKEEELKTMKSLYEINSNTSNLDDDEIIKDISKIMQ
jgi:predicted transcriptional regulator